MWLGLASPHELALLVCRGSDWWACEFAPSPAGRKIACRFLGEVQVLFGPVPEQGYTVLAAKVRFPGVEEESQERGVHDRSNSARKRGGVARGAGGSCQQHCRKHSTCILSFQGGTVAGQVNNAAKRESIYRGRKR